MSLERGSRNSFVKVSLFQRSLLKRETYRFFVLAGAKIGAFSVRSKFFEVFFLKKLQFDANRPSKARHLAASDFILAA